MALISTMPPTEAIRAHLMKALSEKQRADKDRWQKWLNDNAEISENKDLIKFTRRILADWPRFIANWDEKGQHVTPQSKMYHFTSFMTPVHLYDRANREYRAWMNIWSSSRHGIIIGVNAAPPWAKIAFGNRFEIMLMREYGEQKNWEQQIQWDSWIIPREFKKYYLS